MLLYSDQHMELKNNSCLFFYGNLTENHLEEGHHWLNFDEESIAAEILELLATIVL